MSLFSIIIDVIQIRKQEIKLRNLIHTNETVKVLRDNKENEIFSEMVKKKIKYFFI